MLGAGHAIHRGFWMTAKGRTLTSQRRVDNDRFRRNRSVAARTNERPLTLRVFGRLPFTGVSGRTEAGVRKAWKEETAGEFAPTLESVYGEFVAAA